MTAGLTRGVRRDKGDKPTHVWTVGFAFAIFSFSVALGLALHRDETKPTTGPMQGMLATPCTRRQATYPALRRLRTP
jgi:hypothetical protein